jgi:hypothetical protein
MDAGLNKNRIWGEAADLRCAGSFDVRWLHSGLSVTPCSDIREMPYVTGTVFVVLDLIA